MDLELADVAAARYRLSSCQDSGLPCAHDPGCEQELRRLLSRGPSEFPYRQLGRINENMQLTGMGYEAEPEAIQAVQTTSGRNRTGRRPTSAGGHRPCRGRLAFPRSSSGQTTGGW